MWQMMEFAVEKS